MTLPSSSPDALARDPELAALEILDCAADTARRVLFAEYPELACGDVFVEQPGVTARQCLAVALLTAIEALGDSVGHYRALLDNLAHRRAHRQDNDSF